MYRRKRRGRSRLVLGVVLLVGTTGVAAWWFDLLPSFSLPLLAGGDDGDGGEEVAVDGDTGGDTDGGLTPPSLHGEGTEEDGTGGQLAQGEGRVEQNDTRTDPRPNDPVAHSKPATNDSATATNVAKPEERANRTRAAKLAQEGIDLAVSDPVTARRLLSQALALGSLGPTDTQTVREHLTAINDVLVFSPTIDDNDPYTSRYTVKSGDALSTIRRKLGAQVDWRFIQRVNRIARPGAIRVGQTLKVVRGPFHAVVDKSDYRLDLYLGDVDEPLVYVRSFQVGLGENDGTPVGKFRVRANSKLINPEWPNPRTGEIYDADDPKNPIGEHWLGLEPMEERLAALSGYGIHGTIEPDSIGKQASMGCVRMGTEDVALIWELLVEKVSTVTIVE